MISKDYSERSANENITGYGFLSSWRQPGVINGRTRLYKRAGFTTDGYDFADQEETQSRRLNSLRLGMSDREVLSALARLPHGRVSRQAPRKAVKCGPIAEPCAPWRH